MRTVSGTEQTPQAEAEPQSLRKEVLLLVLKFSMITAFLLLAFTLVFGIVRVKDDSMAPALKEGDLAVYYRLQNTYLKSDLAAYAHDGETQIRRVVAITGDKVNVTADGLRINGYLQQEKYTYGTETLPYKNGTEFPLTLHKDRSFLMADNRENAVDSRVYGAVERSRMKGKVFFVIRHKQL